MLVYSSLRAVYAPGRHSTRVRPIGGSDAAILPRPLHCAARRSATERREKAGRCGRVTAKTNNIP